jgi:hypothetical protein
MTNNRSCRRSYSLPRCTATFYLPCLSDGLTIRVMHNMCSGFRRPRLCQLPGTIQSEMASFRQAQFPPANDHGAACGYLKSLASLPDVTSDHASPAHSNGSRRSRKALH